MPSPEEKQRIDYRSRARAHVQAARKMLKSDDAFGPAYACLHARFAIEALAYDRLQDYLFEVSHAAMNGWTPKAVLNELLYTDPDACSPVSLTFSWKPDPDASPQEIHLGDSYPLSAIWANRMHNALGSFLHQPTIKQRTGDESDDNRQLVARRKAEEALQEIDRVLGSTLSGWRAHRLIQMQCKCGSLIARDLEFIEAGKFVACAACGRLYNCRYNESRHDFDFSPQHATFPCKVCGKFNSFDAYEMKTGNVIECVGCGEQFKIEMKPLLTRIVREETDNPS
jgi:transcription elongation factor Elf1